MPRLQRQQILNQVAFFVRSQSKAEATIVVIHDVSERGEAPVVVEAALLMREQTAQRSSAVLMIWSAIRLERVDAHILGRMHVPPWFRPGRLDMAIIAFCFAAEERVATLGRFRIEIFPCFGLRRFKRKLLHVQGRKFLCNSIFIGADMWEVSESVLSRDRELVAIVQPRVEEPALPMHFQIGDERVPIRDGTPTGPGMQVDARQSESGRNQSRRRFAIGTKSLAVQEYFGIEFTGTPRKQHLL